MASITIKAAISQGKIGEWWVRTYLNDEVLAVHGPMPTEGVANGVALEQIEIAKATLTQHKALLLDTTVQGD